ncbi:MAG: hypothetical protein JSV03_14910 [Planctomycetota bacterium]|nr:MAG: hypothetical protein JSV03_14910 [Planctomycetota bacterium]
MNTHRNAKYLSLLLVTCACTLPINMTYGQEDERIRESQARGHRIRTPASRPVDIIERIVRVVQLKHAEAKHVSEIINNIFRCDDLHNTVTCAADIKTNTILVSMPDNLQKKVEELIPKLDVQPKASPAEPIQTRIYDLAHSDANRLAQTLSRILGREARCEYSGRSIVISAPKILQEQATEIIQQLDQPYKEPDLETQIFQIKNVPVKDIMNSLDFITQGKGISYNLDTRKNALIVRTEPQYITLVAETLAKLDQPGPKSPEPKKEEILNSMKVRVVWLISGNENLQADPPPVVEQVRRELDNIGVCGLKLAVHNLVQVFPDGEPFEIMTTPAIGEQCDFNIRGNLQSVDSLTTKLQIELDGELELQREIKRPFHLKTTIQAPIGHSTVLGILPIENLTSVFIVQVTPGG